MTKLFISTDLDGTLLDHYTYSSEAATATLSRLQHLKVPCVLNTSKTFAELISLREQLNHKDPFIVENGAAIYLPKHSKLEIHESLPEQHGFYCKRLGPVRKDILAFLKSLKDQYQFAGFSDISPAEIVKHTGLALDAAQRASEREFTEPIIWYDSEAALQTFAKALAAKHLQLQRGGRFIHVMGQTDKATAMLWLVDLYKKTCKQSMVAVALGDGYNDVGMLSKADIPVVVRSPVHNPPEIPGREDAWLTEGYGPVGWSQSIEKILSLYPQPLPQTNSG